MRIWGKSVADKGNKFMGHSMKERLRNRGPMWRVSYVFEAVSKGRMIENMVRE